MRYLSQIFQPVITIPKNAKIKSTEITCKSQKLLLECGLVRPTSSGFFTILPLARRALDKLENIIKQSIEEAGALRITLPTLVPASLWQASGRLTNVAEELMTVTDRHDKQFLLAPTHEESIADLLADVGPLSYKQLPLLLYQITDKFRDEHRPKHGLLRSRAFAMLDAYGAHASHECALATYARVSDAYRQVFARLAHHAHKVAAPAGDMGGSVSHEWHLPAAAGEDSLLACRRCERAELTSDAICRECGETGEVLSSIEWEDSLLACRRCESAELTSDAICRECGETGEVLSSIEVGHTFILGTKYSSPLKATFTPPSGAAAPLVMSCYGIGVTRLLAACVEACSSPTSIRWPRSIAPYSAVLIGPKEGSKEWVSHGPDQVERVYSELSNVTGLHRDVVIDDRHQLTIGKRLMMADRTGYPFAVVCGKAATERPARYELHVAGPAQSAPRLLTLPELAAAVSGHTDRHDAGYGHTDGQAELGERNI